MDRQPTCRHRVALCLWPGLPQVWWRGSPWALGVAVGFAVLLNLVIVASFGWTEWIRPQALAAGWIMLAVTWVAGAAFSWRRGDHRKADHQQTDRSSRDDEKTQNREADELFRQARDHYLHGNWYEAEETLVQLLRRDPNDVDARLMLATLMRHTERFDDARGQLKQLQRLEAAGKFGENGSIWPASSNRATMCRHRRQTRSRRPPKHPRTRTKSRVRRPMCPMPPEAGAIGPASGE